MKYIVFEGFAGEQIPIIFPKRILHEEMREQVPYSKVLSAGYVLFNNDKFLCYGDVKELNTKARQEEDSQIIAEHLLKLSQ